MCKTTKRILAFLIALTAMMNLLVTPVFAASTRKCFTISSGKTTVYSNKGLTTRYGTIYGSDELIVNTVTSSYCNVTYPISGGRTKTGYISTSAILCGTSGSSYKSRAKITAYRRPGGSSYGYIASGDTVTILGTNGNYTQVKYPVSGGFKYAFITTSACNSYIKPTSTNTNYSGGFDPIWPLRNSYTVTTLYKYSSGQKHSTRFKYGIDMSAPRGEEVLAVESGTVICSEYSKSSGFGNWIMIRHNNGKVSLYAHLDERFVFVDQNVSKGTVIGKVGNTSAKYKVGYHLHFELGESNTSGAVGDPWMEFFKPKYGSKVTLTQAAAKYPTP